jgi:hypothetical protein
MPFFPPRNVSIRSPFTGVGWPASNPAESRFIDRSEYDRQKHAWITCTQLGRPYSAADQRRIVREWCDFFRSSPPLRELALRSRVPTELFDALCDHAKLTRLHVKWGPVSDLTCLAGLRNLEGLSLGTTGVRDISPIGALPKLRMLQLNNFKHVIDFGAISHATNLESLDIAGYWQGPQKIHMLNPDFVRPLVKLKALSISCAIIDKFDISPLLQLSDLQYLDLPAISKDQRESLVSSLHRLRYGNVVSESGG